MYMSLTNKNLSLLGNLYSNLLKYFFHLMLRNIRMFCRKGAKVEDKGTSNKEKEAHLNLTYNEDITQTKF